MTIEQYERQVFTNQGRGPSGVGLQAMASAQNRYFQGLQDFVGGAMSVADYYATSIQERNERDTEVGLSDFFRQRTIQMSSVRGADADNLLINEQALLEDEKTKIRDQFKVNDNTFEKYWFKHTESYYDKVGNHQIQQGKIADENSRFMYVTNAKNDLNNAPVGDLSYLGDFANIAYTTYEHDLPKAYAQVVTGIEDTVTIWAKKDPEALEAWWAAQGDEFVAQYGEAYVKALSTVGKAKTKLDKEQDDRIASVLVGEALQGHFKGKVPTQILNDPEISATLKVQLGNLVGTQVKAAKAAYAAQVKAQEKVAKQEHATMVSGYMGQIFSGTMSADTMLSINMDPRFSASEKRQLNEAHKGSLNPSTPETKANSEALKARILSEGGMATRTLDQTISDGLRDGTLSAEDIVSLRELNNTTSQQYTTENTPFINAARDALKARYGVVTNPLSLVNQDPTKTHQYNTVLQAMHTAIREVSPQEVSKLLNLADPNSYINRLMDTNKPYEPPQVIDPGKTGNFVVLPFKSVPIFGDAPASPTDTSGAQQPEAAQGTNKGPEELKALFGI